MARKDEIYLLYTFESPHNAIKTQKLFESLNPKVIPVLREISESCGMAVKLSLDKLDESLDIIKSSDIKTWTLYRVEISNGELDLKKLKCIKKL